MGVLSLIFFQDQKNREIDWFLPIGLFLALFIQYNPVIQDVVFNILIVGVLMFGLLMYTKVRFKSSRLTEYFGLGDILVLVALTPLLKPVLFIHFITSGSVFCLMFFLIIQVFKKSTTIPFAGYLSLYTMIIIFIRAQVISYFE